MKEQAFKNFKVQRTIEIQMTTQDEKLTQEDEERFVDRQLYREWEI